MTRPSFCQECGKTLQGEPITFYGNVVCSKACQKSLSERVYFRDDPPEPGSTWFCPHCGASNPLGDPRKELRPHCASCGRPLDPASAAPPKTGCLGMLLIVLLPLGLLAALPLVA
jgi:hypothetical protein